MRGNSVALSGDWPGELSVGFGGGRSKRAMSEHLRLEIAHAARGHTLEPGEPVPGCPCTDCVGFKVVRKARAVRHRQWGLLLEQAREVPILEVASRLDLGAGQSRGREVAVLCPLHDDTNPSLLLDPQKNVWFCFACGVGGDGIELVRRACEWTFPESVRWLAGPSLKSVP